MRIALGTGSLITAGLKLDQYLKVAEDLKFEFIDFWMDRENLWPLTLKRGEKEEVIEKISERGLKVISTCPILFKTEDWESFEFEFNLAHPDEGERRKAVKFVKAGMDLSKDMGAGTMLVLPGKVEQPDFIKSKVQYRHYFAQAVKSLKECSEHASELELTLGIENSVVGNFMDRPGELYRLVSEVGSNWVKVYIDTANANVFYPPVEYVKALKGVLADCIHISDNDGSHPNHQPVGMGDIDFKGFLKELKTSGWDGYLILEVFYAENPIEGLKTSKERLMEFVSEI